MSCFPSEPAIPRVSEWYAEGGDPVDGLTSLSRRIRRSSAKGVWIHLTDTGAVAERASFLRDLARDLPRPKLMRRFPLFGIPFAVKDNMDVKGLETTAACPAYAYTAQSTTFAVQKLLDAGAVLMGKTNMDQFATGLVGTRSPYGPCPNAINPRYISGGSSSGSAHAVARGYVSFALGTDTAGSGRIPAALNNIVCLKPTPGLVSIRGIVPACPSLDCVAILALSCGDCLRVFRSVAGVDEDDIWSRAPGPEPAFPGRPLTVGIPDKLEFFGNTAWENAFRRAAARLAAMGWKVHTVDFAPYEEAASMLYFGPYMAERTSVLGDFVSAHREECDPTVAGIICDAGHWTAAETFRAFARTREIKKIVRRDFGQMDALLVPSSSTTYTIDAVLGDPFHTNVTMGTYTNFVNILELCAVAVPSGLPVMPGTEDALPFGVTFIGPSFAERKIAAMASRFHDAVRRKGLAPGVFFRK